MKNAFYPEDSGSMFLGNLDSIVPGVTVSPQSLQRVWKTALRCSEGTCASYDIQIYATTVLTISHQCQTRMSVKLGLLH
jgi:hypothetical protein